MQHIGAVDMFESLQHLIGKVLAVLIGEFVFGVYNFVHVGFHEVKYDIDILKVVFAVWSDQVCDGNNLLSNKIQNCMHENS